MGGYKVYVEMLGYDLVGKINRPLGLLYALWHGKKPNGRLG